MCGILALINYIISDDELYKKAIESGKNRGPEETKIEKGELYELIFHRLAINGLTTDSGQPFDILGCKLICNGEIYNYKQLYNLLDVEPQTESDCEVIIYLYKKYGIEQTLTMLDGEFSFILVDNNKIYVARDPYGVRPLYYSYGNSIMFSSELKCIDKLSSEINNKIEYFHPGHYMILNNSNNNSGNNSNNNSGKYEVEEYTKYIIPSYTHVSHKTNIQQFNDFADINMIYRKIYYKLHSAVLKRYENTHRPIACLLSGGLDSSLVTALVCRINNNKQKIETYSIGLNDSEDLKYARIVAEYLKTEHHEIIVTEQEMIDAIPDIIYNIESYDTTTVRASIGNYLLGKYISKNSEAKVIFNGDGSDELCGGYLYMNKCPDDIEFDKETRRLLKDIHKFDVLRSDKSISSNGLEPRTPFLDKEFVDYYLSIPCHIRNHNNYNYIEKYLLRDSINYMAKDLLPENILYRKKEAFSDGVSNKGKSLYNIIQLYIDTIISDDIPLYEKEKKYYKKIYDEYYKYDLLPYYWMPRYISSNDPSARTLTIYKN